MNAILQAAIGKGPRTQAKLAEIRKRDAELKKNAKKKGGR